MIVKKWLVIGIILSFIPTSVSTMDIGFIDKTMEREEYLKDIAFYYFDEYDSTKLEHYKEYLQRDNSDFTDLGEITRSVESPQTSVSSGPMDSPWPMKCYDLHHTSRCPYSTTHITDLEKWRFLCDGVDGSPIIGDDGTLYFGDKDRDIYAIYPNGTLKWKYHTGGWINSAPALAPALARSSVLSRVSSFETRRVVFFLLPGRHSQVCERAADDPPRGRRGDRAAVVRLPRPAQRHDHYDARLVYRRDADE